MSIKFNASDCVLCFDEANGAETIGAGTTGVDDAGTATAGVETTGIWLAGIVSPLSPLVLVLNQMRAQTRTQQFFCFLRA